MKTKEQILLEQAYYKVSTGSLSPLKLAEKFYNEVLSLYEYKTTGQGHLNCAWVTYAFCEWCNKLSLQTKAIYFVWPSAEEVVKLKAKGILPRYYEDDGMSHIAPLYKGTIMDFTFGQFEPSFNEIVKLTPVHEWLNVYGKYGYGTNEWPKNSGKFVYIDTYNNLAKELHINTHEPLKKTARD